MFERFDHDARHVVIGAQEEARALGHPVLDTSHFLLALMAGTGSAPTMLRAHGLTHERGLEALHTVLALRASAGSSEIDPAARPVVGVDGIVDLTPYRESLDLSFAPDALERATTSPRRWWRSARVERPMAFTLPDGRRIPVVPFGRDSGRTLELTFSEALTWGHRDIRCEHLLLALLRGEGTVALLLLVVLGVDPSALRHEIVVTRPGGPAPRL